MKAKVLSYSHQLHVNDDTNGYQDSGVATPPCTQLALFTIKHTQTMFEYLVQMLFCVDKLPNFRVVQIFVCFT